MGLYIHSLVFRQPYSCTRMRVEGNGKGLEYVCACAVPIYSCALCIVICDMFGPIGPYKNFPVWGLVGTALAPSTALPYGAPLELLILVSYDGEAHHFTQCEICCWRSSILMLLPPLRRLKRQCKGMGFVQRKVVRATETQPIPHQCLHLHTLFKVAEQLLLYHHHFANVSACMSHIKQVLVKDECLNG